MLNERKILPKLVLCFGASGVGKTEFQKVLTEDFNFKWIHPINDLKEFLEEENYLPKGALHTPEGKEQKNSYYSGTDLNELLRLYRFLAKHYGVSGLDELAVVNNTKKNIGMIAEAMIESIFLKSETLGELERLAWHEMKKIDPEFSRPYVEKRLKDLLSQNQDVIMLAIRNQHEGQIIKDTIMQGNCVPYLIKISRWEMRGYAQDKEQDAVLNLLLGVVPKEQVFRVTNNNSTVGHWKQVCRKIGFELKHRPGKSYPTVP